MGGPNDKRIILVDGQRLSITAFLDCALRHIRESHRVLRTWADGVCIGQNDVEDRNQQVRLIGSIYSTARHTVIFPGPSSPECDSTMKLLDSQNPTISQSPERSHGAINNHHIDWIEAMLEDLILAKPWFKRTWVLQELVLSVHPWIQCRKTRVRWDLFYDHVLSSQSPSWRSDSRKLLTGMSDARVN